MKSGLSATLAFAVFSALACSSGESNGPAVAEVGAYQLVSVNGSSVPTVTVQNSTITQEILSGVLQIYEDGTFKEIRTGRATLAGGSPSVFSGTQTGTWEKDGSQVNFTVVANGKTAGTFAGLLSGTRFTFTADGSTFVYTKMLPD